MKTTGKSSCSSVAPRRSNKSKTWSTTQSGLAPGYVGATLEYGQVAERSSDLFDDGVLNGSLYVGFDTLVGPLFLGWGFAEAGRRQFTLRLGRAFKASGNRIFF